MRSEPFILLVALLILLSVVGAANNTGAITRVIGERDNVTVIEGAQDHQSRLSGHRSCPSAVALRNGLAVNAPAFVSDVRRRLAQSGHFNQTAQCPALAAKRTSTKFLTRVH